MAITHAIIKVAQGCNLACKYCYVDHHGFGSERLQLMDEATLKQLFIKIAEHVHSHALPSFTFYWHGGEPLLQPMSFYETIAQFTEEYLSDIQVTHLLQTNATRVTPEYARLLRQIGITVSVSMDGPPHINDKYRTDRKGQPTSPQVLEGIEALRQEGYPFQVLCVITPESIGKGAEIYQYFRSLNATWMDFLLPHANALHTTIQPYDMPTQEQLAEFYIDVYKAWMDEGNPEVCVRRLRDYTMLLLGGAPDSCIFGDNCTHIITVQPDGKVYACDDLLSTLTEALGDLWVNTLDDIEGHPIMHKICPKNADMYGEQCKTCDYFRVCRGGCTNFRAAEGETFTNPHYYCRKMKIVIDYIEKDLLERFVEAGLGEKVLGDVG